MSRNVELKARLADPAGVEARLGELGALPAGVLRQRDTYFRVRRGRLKLREHGDGTAELIAYSRTANDGEVVSEYARADVDDPAALRTVLERAAPVWALVEKTRRLFLWEQTVRIHLDEVAGLGAFLEIEAVAAAASTLDRERDQLRRLRDTFAIAEADVIRHGYADLVAK